MLAFGEKPDSAPITNNDDGNTSTKSGKKPFFKKLFSRSSSKKKSQIIDETDQNKGDYVPPFQHLDDDQSRKSNFANDNMSIATRQSQYSQATTKSKRKRRKGLKRYRGFSTSISSLFLDESLVCPSAAWCGILSSARTEHLLHVRNQERKVQASEKKSPSKILSIAILVTSIAMILTYMIWGFGTKPQMHYGGYYYRNLERNDQLKKHYVPNVMRFKEYHEQFWLPIESIAKDVLYQNEHTVTHADTTFEERSLRQNTILDNEKLANYIRIGLCAFFCLILGILGRRKRMMTRFAVLRARAQDDKTYYGSHKVFLSGKDKKMAREDKYDGACGHSLCGCYPIDRNEDEDEEEQDCMNTLWNKFSKICFGKMCRVWIQCCSICALAQEAREARLLLPPKHQRVDYITHQPFEEYYRNVFFLRRKWKESKQKFGWQSHFDALSKLSKYIVSMFATITVAIILTEQFNPRANFSWADACVLIMTFVQSFVVVGIVHGIFHKSDLSLDAVIKFFAVGFLVATPMAFVIEVIVVNFLISIYYTVALIVSLFADEGVGTWIYDNYKYFMIFADIIQAFLVAAASEEISKYYSFRAIEHPDLIFLTGLDRMKQDVKAKIGGGQSYPYSSNNASLLDSRTGTFESNFSGTRGWRQHRGLSQGRNKAFGKKEFEEDFELRTVRQRAAAVTTAMISTAVGLACAENFIYVFFLGSQNTQEEITMLIFRSIFPVHALCAAIQSLGVIKKFLEEDNESENIGVGSIVWPAIILHGAFDSALMLINSYLDIVENVDDDANDHYDPVLLNTIAGVCVTSVMIIATVWYWRKNRQQKARLKVLELENLEAIGQLPEIV